jgi:hypothetical protein
LFNGKLNFEFDVFRNKRTDILWAANNAYPHTTGIIPPDQNLAELQNQGFDFMVGYNTTIGQEATFSVSLNGGYAINEILFWDEPPGNLPWQVSTGRPIGSELYYNAIGIFRDQAAVDAYPSWPGSRAW